MNISLNHTHIIDLRHEEDVHRLRFEEDFKKILCLDKIKGHWSEDCYSNEMVETIWYGYLAASKRWVKELNNR